MFFRARYTIGRLHLTEDSYQFKTDEGGNLFNIELRKLLPEEYAAGRVQGDALCTAIVERPISAKQEVLFKIEQKEAPTGLRDFLRDLHKELREALTAAVKVFRWRSGITDSYDFLKSGAGFHYSFDGIEWKAYQQEIKMIIDFGLPMLTKDTKANEDCNNLLKHKQFEPLGHELLCEAWGQIKNSHRSALVIGIAAAETGFKECANLLMPEASWLLSNIPSPPLVRMLEEYLPTFKAKASFGGVVLPPPSHVVGSLIKGVNIRNNISHGKAPQIKKDTLDEVLKAVRDLLYLLDIYCGHLWAEKMLSIEARTELAANLKNPK
jgi:hypothetical protein